MQPSSSAFQAEAQASNERRSQVNIIVDSKVVMVIPAFGGSVSADATAANQRTATVQVGDETGALTPDDISSVTAPFGTQMQVLTGFVIPSVSAVSDLDNSAASWNEGTNNGTIGDPVTGALILGWTP